MAKAKDAETKDAEPAFPNFDRETVELMGGHRVGLLQPDADSLIAGELYVEVQEGGPVRLWVGTARPAGVAGNMVMVASSEGMTQPDPITPPGPGMTIALDSVSSPSLAPTTVSGTVTPGGLVDVAIAQDGALFATQEGVDASSGAFVVTFDLPPSDTVYAAVAMPPGDYDSHVLGNTFIVLGPPTNVDVPAVMLNGAVVTECQQGDTLEVTTGNWTGEPTSYQHTWYSGEAVVGGAATYIVQESDLFTTITCTLTAFNAAGNAEAPPSNGVDVIETPLETEPPA